MSLREINLSNSEKTALKDMNLTQQADFEMC